MRPTHQHRNPRVPALLFALASFATTNAQDVQVEILHQDARLKDLIPAGAKVEKLGTGYTWSEGPVWLRADKALVFSDVPNNVAYKWDKAGRQPSEFLKPSGDTGLLKDGSGQGSNGLTVDAQGRLVLMQHGDRRVARLEPNGQFTTLAERYQGKRLNSPNDGAFDASGNLYFTDPPYGLKKGAEDPARELDFSGVYRLDGKTGELTLMTKELKFPNGLAFSPDYKTVYVANSDPDRPILMAYPVKEDGSFGPGKLFADTADLLKAGKPGLPDGLKVDVSGNVFTTGPGGVLIYAPDGKMLGRIDTKVPTANCAWGDDGATLYITANHELLRVRTTTKGKLEGPEAR